jgi:hypothetical protein
MTAAQRSSWRRKKRKKLSHFWQRKTILRMKKPKLSPQRLAHLRKSTQGLLHH